MELLKCKKCKRLPIIDYYTTGDHYFETNYVFYLCPKCQIRTIDCLYESDANAEWNLMNKPPRKSKNKSKKKKR